MSKTDAQRIASIDPDMRKFLIDENRRGMGMKNLAMSYRIPPKTVRAIIFASRTPEPEPAKPVVAGHQEWNDIISPGWQCHGELTPDQARLYPKRDVPL